MLKINFMTLLIVLSMASGFSKEVLHIQNSKFTEICNPLWTCVKCGEINDSGKSFCKHCYKMRPL